MSIAIRVNGRKRSQPPVGPFTVTITQSNMEGYSFDTCYVSPDDGVTKYKSTNDTFQATILYCLAYLGNVGTNHVYFNGVEQTLTNFKCQIALTGDCNVVIYGRGAGAGVDITITNV